MEDQDLTYQVALAALDAKTGHLFAELQAAQSDQAAKPEDIARLKAKFEDCYTLRDRLRDASGSEVQALLDALGPELKAAAQQQPCCDGSASGI